MPSSPAAMCLDCNRRATKGQYCDVHQTTNNATDYRKQFDRYRADDPIRQLYKSQRWTGDYGTRKRVLRRDMHLCVECGNTSATVADHFPTSAREIVAQFGVDEFYNPDRCRALCKLCHDKSTAVREGFARKTQ